MHDKIKTAHDFFQNEKSPLKSILQAAKKIAAINERFLSYLDPIAKNLCQVASLKNQRLVVLTGNSAIATRIRFQSVDLIQRFQHDPLLKYIKEIHCKISVKPPSRLEEESERVSATMALLSAKTAAEVDEMAEHLTDQKLREIMKKIAKRTR